jgi:hypothetical protein
MQGAVKKLEAAGVLERVGTGVRQQIQLRQNHPLTPALHDLFEAERGRVERVLHGLKAAAATLRQARAVWLEGPLAERTDEADGTLVLGVLAGSGEVDALVDVLRSQVTDLMRSEDVAIEVRGWTGADVEALGREGLPALGSAIPLLGTVPGATPDRAAAGKGRKRSHAEADRDLIHRADRVAEALVQRPELVTQAREEIAKRLRAAPPQEARTLREWQQILDGLSLQRLRRFLVDPGERAPRLRQSMPLVLLRAGDTKRGQARS